MVRQRITLTKNFCLFIFLVMNFWSSIRKILPSPILTVVLLTIFFLSLPPNLLADGENLAPNPSFELGVLTPDGWTTVNGVACGDSTTSPPVTFEWEANQGRTGTHSVALKNVNWPTGSTFTPGSWVSSNFIPLAAPPQEYEVSVWVLGTSSNVNLRPVLWICQYGNSGNPLGSIAFTSLSLPGTSWVRIFIRLKVFSGLSQIKLGLAAKCSTAQACSGSLWFDDVSLTIISGPTPTPTPTPTTSSITAHKFKDTNQNGQQDTGEVDLSNWRITLYQGNGCTGEIITSGDTNADGNVTFPSLSPGDYSVRETLQTGWNNITSLCQNVFLIAGQSAVVRFGNVETGAKLNVPYFNQTSPPWGDDIYDYANKPGFNFLCEGFGGPYMSSCGCATTSAAMLLKFYKVDKSPTGESTDPGTLNNWLKARGGYAYGSVVWPFIQTYSEEARPKNESQTHTLKWIGFGPSRNSSGLNTLNSYLNREIPVILDVSNHFVVATGISGATHLIEDPRWLNRTTLESYGNNFLGMRLFEPTHTDLSTIYITTPLPTDILLIDSQGRRVGKDPTTGIIYEEIPNSSYFLEPALVDDSIEDAPLPPASTGVTTLSIVNPQQGNFNIQTSDSEGNYSITFYGFDLNGEPSMQELQPSVTPGATQEFQLNYSQEPGFQIQVTQTVDIDIKPGSDPNSINLKNNGVIPVAILTTPSFDATQVDVSTVRFGPNKATEVHNKGHHEDVDSDGDIDLVLHFKTQETGIQNTDIQACLTGTTLSNIPIQGCDSIKIVGK